MKYEILKTGSKGNSIILNDNILLDAGIPFKNLKKYLTGINIIFISHIHTDHLMPTCIKQIAYNYPTIKFICNGEVANKLNSLGVQQKNIFVLKEHRWYDIGVAKVRLEELKHDAHNSSFQIEYPNGENMIYITDSGEIPEYIDAKDYNLYLIESNYRDDDELDELIQQDYDNGLEFSHYIRVRNTHLSQKQAMEWLQENMGDKSAFEFIHMHEGDKNGSI